ncbi:hypothetical protein L325_0124375 [Yersinia pestis 9]|nr:hypothetical protein L325_0124375 [Yersinia pestis 9]
MEKKLGLTALTALVLSSMLGAGVFSLPQNMAEVASPAALLIGWSITGIGIIFLAFAMLLLTRLRLISMAGYLPMLKKVLATSSVFSLRGVIGYVR